MNPDFSVIEDIELNMESFLYYIVYTNAFQNYSVCHTEHLHN